MRHSIVVTFLVTCLFMTQNIYSDLYGRGNAGYDNCCNVPAATCCDDQTADQASCVPEPTNCYPTICYKPYVYYTPKYHYTCECQQVAVPCKKKCCRMVPKYSEQTFCKYEPKYYTQQYCRYEPEYYCEDDCKYVNQYQYHRNCTYEPHYFYKQECGYDNAPSCAPQVACPSCP